MKTVNIHQAKTTLSRLLVAVEAGESVIIANAGRPVARLVPIDAPQPAPRRIGFLQGMAVIPDDFDEMFRDEIAEMFYGE